MERDLRQEHIDSIVCQLDLGKINTGDNIRGFSYREKQNIVQQFKVYKNKHKELQHMKTAVQFEMFRAAQIYADSRPFAFELLGGLELVLDLPYWDRQEFDTWQYTAVIYIL